MAQPTLGLVTLQYPTDWEITPIIGESSVVTLSGKVRTDVMYRRYKYSLSYEILSRNNYEILENAVNNSIDSGTFPTFTYDKFPNAEDGVSVKPRLSASKKVAGAGSDYYMGVTLELEETEPIT